MRGSIALGMLVWPALAAADPAATLTADVDGDGRPDQIAIDGSGQVLIERAAGGGQMVAFAASGEVTEARLSFTATPTPIVVATAHVGARWEAIALGRGPGPALVELWRGPVGPAGDDDEYLQWIEAGPDGLVRFQERADQRRCDGAPIALFRERWDAKRRSFVAIHAAAPAVPADAPTVKAGFGIAPVPAAWYRATATSQAAGAADAAMLVAPRALADDDPTTAWRSDDDGVGTWWQFRPMVRGGKAAKLRIVPGADREHGRVARLLVVGAGAAAVIEIPDTTAARVPASQLYEATLPQPIDGCVSIALLAVRPGKRPGTALPELSVVADVEVDPSALAPTLIAQVVAGGLAGDSAARTLSLIGRRVTAPIIDALAAAPPAGRRRLFAVLATIPDRIVVAPLAGALSSGELAPELRRDTARRLAGLGPEGPTALVVILTRPGDLDGQLAAVAALAAVDPAALLPVTGQGDRSVRLAVSQALAALPIATLIDAARAATEPAAAADRWRAVGLAAQRRPGDRAAAAVALDGALAQAGKSYELRYRLIAALAPIVDDAGARGLAATLERLPDNAAGHALVRVAARGLAANPTPGATLALAGLTGHADPGVRLDAVRGLAEERGGRPDPATAPAGAGDSRDAADRALVAVLGADHWPMNRKQAAAALAPRCGRAEPARALDAAIGNDDDVPVRVEAVAALAQCPGEAITARLLALVDDGALPLPIRDRALAGYAERPGTTAGLLTRFTRWRGQAFSDDGALRLAIRAATALGQRAAVEAGRELAAAARDQAFPDLAAAATRSLGPTCPADAPALLRTLAASDDQAIATAARAAATECPPR